MSVSTRPGMASPPIGVLGIGMYLPPHVVTAETLADETGIPPDALRRKFGIRQVRWADRHCHISRKATAAGTGYTWAATVLAWGLQSGGG